MENTARFAAQRWKAGDRMNLLDYNMVIEALDKQRQLLLNREMYEAEHILVNHAINVVAELPIIRQPEIVRCNDCKFVEKQPDWDKREPKYKCTLSEFEGLYDYHDKDWFCADGERKEGG